uniref:TNFR-Cys domain-containing protein n=1 Tax=Seriola lalandi dorsalis TaxID=1841481 RepID=A0A3B4YCZ2_SERLL
IDCNCFYKCKQLSQDCGFGDGGEGVCILCEEGKFSSNTGVDPCRRCTQCNLLNRLEKTACSLTNDALCGQCLPGIFLFNRGVKEETFSMVLIGSATASSIFLIAVLLWASLLTAERYSELDMIFLFLLIICLLFASLSLDHIHLFQYSEQVPEYCHGPEGRLSAAGLQHTPLSGCTETTVKQSEAPSQTTAPAEDSSRCFANAIYSTISHSN